MKKSTRIKPQPLATRAEFLEIVDELAKLETDKRAIEAARDHAVQQVKEVYDRELAPVAAEMKGKLALAEAYAEAHRDELLPTKAKSASTALATYGWRTGNRAVALLSRVTIVHAIRALKAIGLGAYVRQKEELAKDLILAHCKDDKTITVLIDPCGNVEEAKPLSEAGLKIVQEETFFIEPAGPTAQTLKTEAA